MLKKEIFDSLKIFGECLLLLVCIPLGYVFDKFVIQFGWSFSEVFNFVYRITMIVYPIAAGLTLFQSEKKDRAFEYLFSLPLSRLKIITYKILPRLSLLMLLIIISTFFSVFNNIWINGFNLIVLFLISIVIGFLAHTFMTGVIEISLIFYVYYLASLMMYPLLTSWEIAKPNRFSTTVLLCSLLTAALLLIPFGTAFWTTFKKFDVKPLKWQLKTYIYIVLPTIGAFATFIAIFFKKFQSMR